MKKTKKNPPVVPVVCDHDFTEPTCIFGCGTTVDEDTGVCLVCRDYSSNEVECLKCGIILPCLASL